MESVRFLEHGVVNYNHSIVDPPRNVWEGKRRICRQAHSFVVFPEDAFAIRAALPHARGVRTEGVVAAVGVENVEGLAAGADDEVGEPEGEEQIPEDED